MGDAALIKQWRMTADEQQQYVCALCAVIGCALTPQQLNVMFVVRCAPVADWKWCACARHERWSLHGVCIAMMLRWLAGGGRAGMLPCPDACVLLLPLRRCTYWFRML